MAHSQDFLNEQKAKLEEKKADLNAEIKLLEEEDSFADPDRTVGNAEEADEAQEGTSHLETELKKGNANISLGLVEKALARLDQGTYGMCEVGKEEIDEDRLKALPEAENCLNHEIADDAVEAAKEFLDAQEE